MSRLLTRREVEKALSVSRSTLLRWIEAGKFPRPIRLGARSLRWPAESVDDFVKARAEGAE